MPRPQVTNNDKFTHPHGHPFRQAKYIDDSKASYTAGQTVTTTGLVDENYPFRSGKHAGRTFEEVLKDDPHYIRFYMERFDWFTLTHNMAVKVAEVFKEKGISYEQN